ncbi:MAG: hypothetical protein QOJ65_2718 [Fimbriimonadaceae bacterium]|jgi:uncharacterized protein (DUF1501 family)|nr:hypothetical protein [Fimbriimonadaceae bacterium]
MADISRRDLLRGGGLIAVGLVAPKWLSTIARADLIRQAKGGKAAKDTVLVVCQLTGGNDGLNTVIPYSSKAYYDLRPVLGMAESRVLKLNDQLGLHPALTGVHDLFKEGKVAIVQNVGYPNPNRSHFKSMDIWQSASPDRGLKYGWIGRHFDQQLAGGALNPVVALGLSTEKPLALSAKKASIPCFASLVDIQTMVGDPDSEKMLRNIQGMEADPGSNQHVVQQASNTALDAMTVLNKQLTGYAPKQEYGEHAFGQGFKQLAQIVATSPSTRVLYFAAGGFDTHARQDTTHETLLDGFSKGVTAFQREMEAIGKADKVIVLVFSEFGRRVYENGSGGTDHGTAAPMFLIGSRVKGGFHGSVPDLSDLDNGDLKFKIDFREVYAATLDQWIGGDSEVVLGQKFNHAEVL